MPVERMKTKSSQANGSFLSGETDMENRTKNTVVDAKVCENEEDESSAKTKEKTKVENPKATSSQTEEVQLDTTPRAFRKGIQLLRRRYGVVLAALLPIMFSLQSMFVYVLSDTLDSFQIVFMHTPVFMICMLLLLLYSRVRPPSDWHLYPWLIGSGFMQAGNSCCFALSLNYLTVGDSVTIFYTAVIQVGFLSRIILKEPVRLFQVLFALLAFVGVIFIARPPFLFRGRSQSSYTDVSIYGVIFAFSGSLTLALFSVFNRKLSILGVNSFFCMFCNSTMAVLISGGITLILQTWRWPTGKEMLYATLVSISYAGGHITMFYALKTETATIVNVMLTSDIILIFVLQSIFLHIIPFWTSYIGASLIFIACIGITLKSKSQPSQTSIPG